MRIKYGAENLYSSFFELWQTNSNLTISRLNDTSLSFPSFYLLSPYIGSLGLSRKLNERNRVSMAFSQREHIPVSSMAKNSLNWIFSTGIKEDGLCEDFDELLDISCQKLLLEYSENSLVTPAIELMFKRNQAGGHVHDLAWCVCEVGQLEAMELISRYLLSEYICDNALAYRLLNFKPELQPDDKYEQYQNFHRWLKENRRFVRPSHQSFNESSNPKAWRVDLSSKYLYKDTSSPVPNEYRGIVNAFLSLDESEQKTLAKYSFKLHHNDLRAWNSFIKSPIEHQLNTAKMSRGGIYFI